MPVPWVVYGIGVIWKILVTQGPSVGPAEQLREVLDPEPYQVETSIYPNSRAPVPHPTVLLGQKPPQPPNLRMWLEP